MWFFFLFISLELYALCKNANEKNIHCKFILLCTKFFKNLFVTHGKLGQNVELDF